MKKRVLIIGGNGQIGRALQDASEMRRNFDLAELNRAGLDLQETHCIQSEIAQKKPDAVVNCAAFTQVDLAEENQNHAERINVQAVGEMAKICNKLGIPLIHFSTDYVYHNDLNRPMTEEDSTEPKGVYAKTKLDGELLALRYHNKTCVIRTSWVYYQGGKNFVRTMLNLGAKKKQLEVVNDQVGSPTYAGDIAHAVYNILSENWASKSDTFNLHGVFNFSNSGYCSWYDFARKIMEYANLDCQVLPVGSEAFPRPAPRPDNSRLNLHKISTTFDIQLVDWAVRLESTMAKMLEEH